MLQSAEDSERVQSFNTSVFPAVLRSEFSCLDFLNPVKLGLGLSTSFPPSSTSEPL